MVEMMVNIVDKVKRMMGWCPQEKVVYNCEDVFFSHNTLCASTDSYNEKRQYMDIPVQMFDWRIFVIIFGSIGLLLTGIQRSDIYMVPLSLLLYASLFIFDRTKISVYGEMLTIRTPVLGEKRIHKNDIDEVGSFENYGHKHRVRTLISLTLIILIALAGISGFSIMSVVYGISSLLLIYVIYSGNRRANYPNIIKINARGRDMFFYPRNEHDLLMLMGIAPEKSKSRK